MPIKFRKPLAIIAAVVMFLMLAIGTAVPAFAAETATSATDSNPQIVYEEPDLGESDVTDNFITLPDAPEKDGYTFKGWRVNGGSDLYDAGDVVVKDGSEEIHLQPVYEAVTGTNADDNNASSTAEEADLLNEYEDGSDIVLQYGHDNILILPDAKEKEGYGFYGWSINGSTDLHESGSTVPVEAGEQVTLRPVYVSTKEANAISNKFTIAAITCFILFLVVLVASGAAISYSYELSQALGWVSLFLMIAFFVLPIVGLVEGNSIMQQALADTLQQLKYMTP